MAASLRRWRTRIPCRCAAAMRERACVLSRACAAPPGADGLFYRGVHDEVCSSQPRNTPSRQDRLKISSSVRPASMVLSRHSGRRGCSANGSVQCGCGARLGFTAAMRGGNKCALFESSHGHRVSYGTLDALYLSSARPAPPSDRDFPVFVGTSPVPAALFLSRCRFRARGVRGDLYRCRPQPWDELLVTRAVCRRTASGPYCCRCQ